MNFRDFIPPIFVKTLHRIRGSRKADTPEIYSNYQSALKQCGSGYQDVELCDLVADKTILFRDTLPQNILLSASHAFLFAAIYHTRAGGANSMTILDFGGACGAQYFDVRRFFPPGLVLKWIVAETEQMVRSAKSRNLETKELTFVDNLDNLPAIDLIFTSGALQYAPAPHIVLDKLLKLQALSILFGRMTLNENDRDLVAIQSTVLSVHGPGPPSQLVMDRPLKTPHTTISFPAFQSRVEKEYRLVWLFNDPAGLFPLGNEPIIGRALFYKRIP